MRVLIYIFVAMLFVACEAEVDMPDASPPSPSPKPAIPIKRRPIGGTDIQRPRIIEDRNWSIGILPPHNLPKPYSVVVRSVATDEKYSAVLMSEDDVLIVPRKVLDDEYEVIVEYEDVIGVELVTFGE